jgi:hypothetical protein
MTIRFKPSIRASNNACGAFLISIILFLLVLGLNHSEPKPGMGVILTLLGLIVVASLALWTWITFQLAIHD